MFWLIMPTDNAKDLNDLKKFLKVLKKEKRDARQFIKWSALGIPLSESGKKLFCSSRVAACQGKPCPWPDMTGL